MPKRKAKKDEAPPVEKKEEQKPEAPPEAAKPEKKVAIVGCSDTKTLAPLNDPSWEIWAMNNAFAHVTKRDVWFEVHPIKYENGIYYRRQLVRRGVFTWSQEFRGATVNQYMQMLAELDIPVYMQRHWECIPKSVPYPLQEIVQKFGTYFTNSVSYMIALAILQGATHIGCWGVDMATGSEYGHQRPSCEFFLGIAAGLGIIITIPPEADLLKTRFLYGFQEREATQWESKMLQMLGGMEKRKNEAAQKAQLSQKQVDQYLGAEMAIREIQRIWSNHQDTQIWQNKEV